MNWLKTIYDWLFKSNKSDKTVNLNIIVYYFTDQINRKIENIKFTRLFGSIYISKNLNERRHLIKLNTKQIIATIVHDSNLFMYLQIYASPLEGFKFSEKLYIKYHDPKLQEQLKQYVNGKINKITYKPKKIRRRYIRYQI